MALQTAEVAYNYRFQLIAPDGTASGAPTVLSPFADSYPTTCWKPGEDNLIDRVRLPLSVSIPGGWWVDMAIVDVGTGQALPLTAADGTHAETIRLGPFSQ